MSERRLLLSTLPPAGISGRRHYARRSEDAYRVLLPLTREEAQEVRTSRTSARLVGQV